MSGFRRVRGKHRQLEFKLWERAWPRRYLAHPAGKRVLVVVFEQPMHADGYFLREEKCLGRGPAGPVE
eukprot:3986146-Pyramimonas_sp.AAC.1